MRPLRFDQVLAFPNRVAGKIQQIISLLLKGGCGKVFDFMKVDSILSGTW